MWTHQFLFSGVVFVQSLRERDPIAKAALRGCKPVIHRFRLICWSVDYLLWELHREIC